MEIMDYLTKERSQDKVITSVRSLLVDTTDFHQKNYIYIIFQTTLVSPLI